MTEAQVVLKDKLVNVMSGLGTDADKNTYTKNEFIELDDVDLAQMYASNWMIGKIIDLPVEDVMRKPRDLSCPSSPESVDAFKSLAESSKIDLDTKITEALKWARLFGGGALVLGIDGTGKPEDPLIITSVKKGSLKFVHAVSRSELTPGPIDTDVMSPTYGEPKHFRLKGGSVIHASRVVPIRGVKIPSDQITITDDFWGVSVVQRSNEPVSDAMTVLAQLASMVFEANVDVVAVRGLSAKLATNEGVTQVTNRFRVGNVMKSAQQMLLLDADIETYSRNPVDVGRFPELIPTYLSVVSGAANIPATRFLGKSPDGMNATGLSDETMYVEMLASMQSKELKRVYERIDPILLMSATGSVPDDWEYTFPPIAESTEREKAEVAEINTRSDQASLQMGVINEYHVADRLLKSGMYPAMTEEDVAAVKEVVDFKKKKVDTDNLDAEYNEKPMEEEQTDVQPTEVAVETNAGNEVKFEEEPVQNQALNGAQIASLVEIAVAVAAGTLSNESAQAIVMASIPGISVEAAANIVGQKIIKTPTPAAPTPEVVE